MLLPVFIFQPAGPTATVPALDLSSALREVISAEPEEQLCYSHKLPLTDLHINMQEIAFKSQMLLWNMLAL